MPFECVARGYLAGSGWKEYQSIRRGLRHHAPRGPARGRPAPRADLHARDEGGVRPRHQRLVRRDGRRPSAPTLAARLKSLTLELYGRAATYAAGRGIVLADTKFEFGLDASGAVVWIDEALTPDSSRFWPADTWRPGGSPPSFDKQFVRDFLETTGWNKTPPAPLLPPDVVAGTRTRYVEAYERLTGLAFRA